MIEKNDGGSKPANLEILIASSKGDKEYMKVMLDLFASTAAQCVEEMRNLCAVDGKEAVWAKTAHGLKGAAAVVGAETLQRLCDRAQSMQDTDQDKKKEIFVAIESEYQKLKTYLATQG